MKKSPGRKKPAKLKVSTAKPLLAKGKSVFPFSAIAGVLGGWILSMLGLLSLPNYNAILPGGEALLRLSWGLPVVLGIIVMTYSWRKVSSPPENGWDISPWSARFWFWGLMGLAIYLRMFDVYRPNPDWWDDHYIHTSDIRSVVEMNFRPFFFPSGNREPFFPYLTAGLWYLAPQITPIVMMQIGNMIFDLASIWMFYLIGKEIAGRRLGIFFMGMGAISKILIEVTKNQMGCDSCVLGGAVAILFLLRLFKKPDLRHFLEWALAVGFGGYTYVPLRPWLPVMLAVVLTWILYDPRERRTDPYRMIIGPGFMLAWAFLFLYKNFYFPFEGLGKIISHPVTLWVTAIAIAWSYFWVYEREKTKGFSRLFLWATASIVIGVCVFPLYQFAAYGNHVRDMSFFANTHEILGPEFVKNLFRPALLSFGPGGPFDSFPPAPHDSMYGFFTTAAALLWVAYFLAWPSWFKALFPMLFLVSWIPGMLSFATHSQRLVGATTPFFLAGAWGLDRLWSLFLQAKPGKVTNLLCAFGFLALGGIQLNQNMKDYQYWMAQRSPNATVYDLAAQELASHTVYMKYSTEDFLTKDAMDVLSNGKTVFHLMQEVNPIVLLPGETSRDLAVILYGEDKETQKNLDQEFPDIPWKKSWKHNQHPDQNAYIWYKEIPFEKVKDGHSHLFPVRTASPYTWERFYYGRFGFGLGMIRYRDRAKLWNDPIDAKGVIVFTHTMRMKADWQVQAGGTYTFSLTTGNPFNLYIDGRLILRNVNREFSNNRTAKEDLSPGLHHVEILNDYVQEDKVPTVKVLTPGSASPVPLDELVFKDAPQDPAPGSVSQAMRKK
ncbi:MAG TPA: hypothetical protein VMV05_10955 [bacterium]|nr:hypothetical protein [bacterium]